MKKFLTKRLKINLLSIICAFTTLNLNAQLNLIPYPKEVKIQNLEVGENEFIFTENTKIIAHSIADFYLKPIFNTIKKELNIDVRIAKKAKSNFIALIQLTDEKELKKFLSKNNLNPNFEFEDEGYVLNITSKSIQVIAPTDAGIFYGIQTLKQIIKANSTENRVPCLKIYDKPDLAIRAWQDDISRGPIPTMDLMKQQIREMASYKLNYFTLYIEHVFKLEKHPKIAPKEGITKAEIDELTEYAKKHHVQLIGNYQSFGHMEETLIHPDYKHLAENEHIISPALPESYEFLDDVYQEIVPVFEGEYFNINCDETFGLGEGKSKTMMDTMGLDGIYIHHINKLNDLLKKYDKKILMWGDIIASYPESIKKLPKDMTVIAWGYHDADDFDYAITPISNSGLNFWVAPGVSCWGNVFPNFKTAEINIYNFIRDGVKNGATGVFNTTWDDDGMNFFQNNWHGLIWGAENSWNTPVFTSSIEASKLERKEIYDRFNQAYDPLFFGLKEDKLISEIIEFSSLHQSKVRDLLRNGRFLEPIFPIHLEYISEKRKAENLITILKLNDLTRKLEEIEPKVRDNSITLEYLKFAIRQTQFTLRKNLFRISVYDFINKNDNVQAAEIKSQNKELIESVKQLKSDYSELWNQENRTYWLDENMKIYDELIEDLENIEGYCLITPSENLSEKGREIKLNSIFNDLPISYTITKDSQTSAPAIYTKPFFVTEDVKIKAHAFEGEKKYNTSKSHLLYHKAIGKMHKLNAQYSTYHPSYDAGGEMALLDGKTGDDKNLLSGFWQGYAGQNIDVEIDLEKIQPINFFSMGFFQNTFSWVILPKKVEIWTKNSENEQYSLLKTIENTISPKEDGNIKHNLETTFENTNARFVKVVAHYYGKLPEWHHAGGSHESMIFADEIILR